jgi:hypothetical protein
VTAHRGQQALIADWLTRCCCYSALTAGVAGDVGVKLRVSDAGDVNVEVSV